jgi:hypothetical protein
MSLFTVAFKRAGLRWSPGTPRDPNLDLEAYV